jgi:hypothetical protein
MGSTALPAIALAPRQVDHSPLEQQVGVVQSVHLAVKSARQHAVQRFGMLLLALQLLRGCADSMPVTAVTGAGDA